MGSATPWGRPEEEAAYRYGKDMGASETFSEHSWDEAEPALKSGWERRHAFGDSQAWSKIKAAARRGWDRVRSR
jgi:hypothetical protein